MISMFSPKAKDVVKRAISPENKKKAQELTGKILNGEVLNSKDTVALDKPDIRMYVEKILDEAGLKDEYIASRLKKLIDAGTSPENLKYTKPMVALQAIRTTYELKDRFPAAKIEARTMNLDIQLRNMSAEELRQMLADLHSRTQSFLKMVDKR